MTGMKGVSSPMHYASAPPKRAWARALASCTKTKKWCSSQKVLLYTL